MGEYQNGNTQIIKMPTLEKTEISGCDVYIGKYAGKDMLFRLQDAKKSIKIVSPYLSADIIAELFSNGPKDIKDIKIITTFDENKDNRLPLTKLICNYHDSEYKTIFETVIFKTTKIFTVHEKMVIVDDEIAFMGSFNFTDFGVKNNIETAITITDPDVVKMLIVHFDELFLTNAIDRWNIAKLGKIIHPDGEKT